MTLSRSFHVEGVAKHGRCFLLGGGGMGQHEILKLLSDDRDMSVGIELPRNNRQLAHVFENRINDNRVLQS